MISFTGSTRVGKRGREVAAATVKRVPHSDDAASRARKARPVANASILWRQASTAIPVRPRSDSGGATSSEGSMARPEPHTPAKWLAAPRPVPDGERPRTRAERWHLSADLRELA
jgi:hypothetical protein